MMARICLAYTLLNLGEDPQPEGTELADSFGFNLDADQVLDFTEREAPGTLFAIIAIPKEQS